MMRLILLSDAVYMVYKTLAPNQYLELFYDKETDELFCYVRTDDGYNAESEHEGLPNIVRIGVLEPGANWEYEDFVEGVKDRLMDMNIECYDCEIDEETAKFISKEDDQEGIIIK